MHIVFNFYQVQFVYFPLGAWAFGVQSKKLLPNPKSQGFTPMFSFKSFIVLALTLCRSLLIVSYCLYVLWVRGLNSLFLWGYLVVLVPFFEKIILALLSGHGTLIKKQLTINVRRVYFWTLIPVSLMYVSILVSVPHYLDNYSLVVSVKIRKCEPSKLVLLFQYCFVYLSPEYWHIKFRIPLSISAKRQL